MQLPIIKGINDKPRVRKAERVIGFSVPKLGRIAISRDPGEASLFAQHFLHTRLSIRHLDGKGKVIKPLTNVGAGTVTAAGVLRLAGDITMSKEAESLIPFNIWSYLEYQAWSKAVTESQFSVILTEPQAPNTVKATKITTREVNQGTTAGKPKIVTKGKIKAESTTEIKSWGLFAAEEKLNGTAHGTAEKAESVTEKTLKIAAAAEFTESTTKILGERNNILLATETNESWLLPEKNTKTVATGYSSTVGGTKAWFKVSDGTFGQPGGTTPFKTYPLMWDQKKFTTVGVETGNEIEFIYELEFPANG